ncbi:hypothetical protein LPN01_09595 [Sphingomonas sp. A2-49]|uniref:carph-isopro domain-containing protein n=1 Tax=Sphingomonas sp. A2-49 TaxID=1391375 RepID=UPI0021D2C90A|nr:hypothetical protein [Sphingomonas sp. A2-49]MCU6454332.1 hypothetical protein [Sphingomonas sp. A2-49]
MTTLFDKFGGIRPMAAHLGEAPSTVQSWKNAGRVPAGHQHRVLQKAGELGLAVTAEDVVYPLSMAPECPVGRATSAGKADEVSDRASA